MIRTTRDEKKIVAAQFEPIAADVGFGFAIQHEEAVIAIGMNIVFAFTAGGNIYQVQFERFGAQRGAIGQNPCVGESVLGRTDSRPAVCPH
jgi:hypothetical protein